MPVSRWIRPLALAGVLLCFGVVVLGAYVRLTAAGLGCPDWPGCYGQVTPLGAEQSVAAQAAYPLRPLNVGKAWREMIHRYAASTLGLIIVVISATAIATRRRRIIPLRLALTLLATVAFQGILGMLTVTRQLKPLIVTGHLVFGLTTLSLLWWLWLGLRSSAWPNATRRTSGGLLGSTALAARRAWLLALIGFVALGLQIALGGWTSSNYAAISCPDFPTCQGAWWPPADFRSAFTLWHGLDINYEGGVLASPARAAIHLTHRMGAIFAALTLLAAALNVLRAHTLAGSRLAAGTVIGALALQLAIGISMVLHGFPLLLATAHTAGAALLVLATLALLHRLRSTAHGQSF